MTSSVRCLASSVQGCSRGRSLVGSPADFDRICLIVNYTVEASTLDDYGETVHTKSRDHQQKYVVRL